MINPKDFTVHSVIHSQHTKPFTEKVSPMAAGVKFRLAFGKPNVE